MTELTKSEWREFIRDFPETHLLQTSAWGQLKSEFGWQVVRVVAPQTGGEKDGAIGAQILFRRLPFGFSMAYIPKGPVGVGQNDGNQNWEALWPAVDAVCRSRKSVFLKVEPDLWSPADDANQESDSGQKHRFPGFRLSPHSVQPPRTIMVDLSGTEDQILSRMKQKTRYNIRLARKKGVVVYPSADIDTFYELMTATGDRAEFGVHSKAYYRRAYELFQPRSEAELLIAEYVGEPLAGLMAFARGKRAWYLYGASAARYRERMPTYILQWEAMRWARGRGCDWYDLWGVPDADQKSLEANFTQRSDGLWGVYRFKRGFGGLLKRAAGPWDRVYNPLLYQFYRWWMSGKTSD